MCEDVECGDVPNQATAVSESHALPMVYDAIGEIPTATQTNVESRYWIAMNVE